MMYELPWPPSINHYWRRVGNRTLISREGRAFRAAVIAKLAGCEKIDGRLWVTIYAHPPDKRRRDLDNLLKPVLDALEHAGVYDDDGQIDNLSIYRCDPCEGGKVDVLVTSLPVCTCPTMDGVKVTGSSCPVHGWPTGEWGD